MYGIDSTLMKKMQMLIRQKIYKEMLEEQAKQKRQNFQPNYKHVQYNRNKTQTNEYDIKNSRPNNIFQQTTRGLDHSSTFLPVISSKKNRPGIIHDQALQQDQKYSKEYQRYLQRRQKNQPNKNFNYRLTNEEQESFQSSEKQTIPNRQSPPQQYDDDMTQLYLQQCEQIISSLKDITLKSSKKIKPKPNKYEPQETFLAKRIPSRSFRAKQQLRPKYKSYTPKHYSFSDPKTPISYSSLQMNSNNQFQEYAHSSQIRLSQPQYKQSDMRKQANQFSSLTETKLTKLSAKTEKIRQNNRKLSPLRQRDEKANDQQLEEQQQELQSKIKKDSKKQQKSKAKYSENKSKNDQKEKPRLQKPTEKTNKLKLQKPDKTTKKQKKEEPIQNELERQQKKQSAIIKYLKKARACGNLLYQKIEGHKKNEDEEGEPANNQKPEQGK